MQSKGAKIGFLILIVVIFGGGLYFMYGPNSHNAQQNEWAKNEYSKYIRAEAEIISWESNGRIGKREDKIYTLQFKEEKTQSVKTANVSGRDIGFDLNGKEKGSKVVLYYNPENPNVVISEKTYNETK